MSHYHLSKRITRNPGSVEFRRDQGRGPLKKVFSLIYKIINGKFSQLKSLFHSTRGIYMVFFFGSDIFLCSTQTVELKIIHQKKGRKPSRLKRFAQIFRESRVVWRKRQQINLHWNRKKNCQELRGVGVSKVFNSWRSKSVDHRDSKSWSDCSSEVDHWRCSTRAEHHFQTRWWASDRLTRGTTSELGRCSRLGWVPEPVLEPALGLELELVLAGLLWDRRRWNDQ